MVGRGTASEEGEGVAGNEKRMPALGSDGEEDGCCWSDVGSCGEEGEEEAMGGRRLRQRRCGGDVGSTTEWCMCTPSLRRCFFLRVEDAREEERGVWQGRGGGRANTADTADDDNPTMETITRAQLRWWVQLQIRSWMDGMNDWQCGGTNRVPARNGEMNKIQSVQMHVAIQSRVYSTAYNVDKE